jgi:TetR/AcrR family transcriptional repressor of nem operon
MSDTRQHIIEIATRLVQERGYNAFSYNDIADELGIKKASIHYHFPTKAGLVKTIMSAYREQHRQALANIDRQTSSPLQKLRKFAGLFSKTLGEDYIMCPSGMLASDAGALPEEVLREVHAFFTDSETWLGKVLNDGRKQGRFHINGSVADYSRTLFAAFEGALLAARAFNDRNRLNTASRNLINSLLIKNRTGALA